MRTVKLSAMGAIMGMTPLVSGCAAQSQDTSTPIGISRGINGLQKSDCNCGGLVPEKEAKARERVMAKTPVAQRTPITN